MNHPNDLHANARHDQAVIEGELDALEIAAALADGGIQASELSDEQLRTLLRAEAPEVISDLLKESQAGKAHSESTPYSLAAYLKRWRPVIGSLAAAAILALVAWVGLQPRAGFDWDTGRLAGPIPIKSGPSLYDDAVVTFVARGTRGVLVLDMVGSDAGRNVSFALAAADEHGDLRPHAVITLVRDLGSSAMVLDAGRPGASVDVEWVRTLCDAGFSAFAISRSDGEAIWGRIAAPCQTIVIGTAQPGARSWAVPTGAVDEPAANPDPRLRDLHVRSLRSAPFEVPNVWRRR